MASQTETLEFQAETRQLLQLVIHSIYSNKDIFLRELISNASDALDKLRLESLTDSDLAVDTADLHITLEADREARTLTVRDNGIGMTRDEVVDLIGTIAKSGTASLLAKIKEAKDAEAAQSLIGQFGVGFYSAFMVADKVTLRTRRAGTEQGTAWESDGEGSYTVSEAEGLPVGTSVTLHLKPADGEDGMGDYLAGWKIRQIVKQYSDFIRWPIRMAAEAGEAGEDGTRPEPETLNSMKALWARPRSEVTEAEYHEFYQQISHDWQPPAQTIHMKAEGTFEYEALLFLPAHAPFDLFARDTKRGVQLYVKRVFIMDDCEALMPNYLRFVKGVVDAHDLSLNVSREILQHDRQITAVRRRLVKKVLGAVKDLRTKDAEGYAKLWEQFGRVLKEGLIEDRDNTDALLELVSADSTHDPEQPTTLRGYVERMKEGQDCIYYLTGENRAMVENSPHMEAVTAKGYEVLILTDPVDEVWTDQVPAFDGHRFQSIAKGQVDLGEEAEGSEEAKAEKAKREEDYAALLGWLGTTLAEQVKEVRLSSRLTTSAACLVGDANDLTPTLEKMYRAMGQELPPVKRILELNPTHPLVTALYEAHRAEPGAPALVEIAELVHGSALLAEGGDLPDPARFTRLLTDRLARTL
ncbi:molecular chaperone HtpG [Kitasatospora sp. MMS16-BH015]|uniref:molecular chaperone HtpG n=1 Tax=Kitasatospora sp. MMS16-BH015 TaxID=2018025 RepID=UPI000CA28282|nr:molecular chaperone HtpG [Kitasatospora sp. MMS16-BH015]AUG81520.1 molecular chaperone HtpG [Kitasatospora sp. MMS16-BH015]